MSIGMMGRTMGAGQVYLESQKDSTGAWLDGGKHTTLHVPKDAPVVSSFTVYDNESRCLIDTGSYPGRSSRDDIITNADGSTEAFRHRSKPLCLARPSGVSAKGGSRAGG